MDTETAIQQIANLDLLGPLPQDVRAQVANVFLDVSDLIHFNDGEPLINSGYLAFGTGYVLFEGAAAVERDGQEPIELKAPALLGEMAQFKSADIRSATVRARGSANAAHFYWDDLYQAAEKTLPEAAHLSFRTAVERQTWDRFDYKEIVNLPLFADLSEDLRLKVCLPLPMLSERITLGEVETLFNQASQCKGQGHLLVEGKLKLYRKDGGERHAEAPDIVGIFPNKSETGVEWSATAMANGPAVVLRFSWEQYTAQIVKRLTRDEQKAFVSTLKNNAGKHFWH
ncbi:MAG: hypothetical protein HYV26_16465 [Candidatus Hydrogenedentes bacterium]|nr:hypothetical protein [Candidatus Hydrogenedentota bacterium]